MNKDFNAWNEVKKSVQLERGFNFVQEGDIWWSTLGVNIGSEQDGKHGEFERPILVIKRINLETAIIVPLTNSTSTAHPYRLKLQNLSSVLLLAQIRLISTKRLSRKVKRISKVELQEVKLKIRELFI